MTKKQDTLQKSLMGKNLSMNNQIISARSTDNKNKLFVMLFADSDPFARISLNLKPGYAQLQVIKLTIPRHPDSHRDVAPG